MAKIKILKNYFYSQSLDYEILTLTFFFSFYFMNLFHSQLHGGMARSQSESEAKHELLCIFILRTWIGWQQLLK